jgi:hypothetical protein
MVNYNNIDTVLERIVTEDPLALKPHTLMYYAITGMSHDLEAAYALARDFNDVVAMGYRVQRQFLKIDERRKTMRDSARVKLSMICNALTGKLEAAAWWSKWQEAASGVGGVSLPDRVKVLERLFTEDDKNIIAVLGLKTPKKDAKDFDKLEYYDELGIMLARRDIAKLIIESTNYIQMKSQEHLA